VGQARAFEEPTQLVGVAERERARNPRRRHGRTDLRVIVEALHAKGALRAGLDVKRATDILWTLNHPDLWQLLVADRGWTPDEYEQWFADSACSQLLATG
jgi:hypothetical protein